MAITSQVESAKETLRIFLSAYFDGWSHDVSGVSVEFPDCYIRMFYTHVPENASKVFDKPLIVVLLAPGADERGKWITDRTTGSSEVFVTWDKHPTAVGYYVYRSITEVGGYVRVSDLLTGLSYVDTPSAGDYWYQVRRVDDEDAETIWGDPTNLISSDIVIPKVTRDSELMFHIVVSATLSQSGQKVVDEVSSLLTALFNSSQAAYLKNAGLKFPQLTAPASLRPEKDIWASSMFLTVRTIVEYS